MKYITLLILLAIYPVFSDTGSQISNQDLTKPLKQSIVQVKITVKRYNYYNPWRLKKPVSYNAVGVVVENNRILVFTHLIENNTLIEVKKHSSYQLKPARVVAKDYESNLSLLQVEDKDFFSDLKPLSFATKVPLSSTVTIAQLDNSGASQKASGKTTNMDMEKYPVGYTELPYLNITSEEKHEGNGELILAENQPIALLYQFSRTKNTGRAIPGFIINTFLKNAGQDQGSAFSHSGIIYRPLLDKTTKQYFGLPKQENGVLVVRVIPFSSAEGIIQVNDIILAIGKKKLDSKGYFNHRLYEKQALAFLANCGQEFGYHRGDKLKLEIIRNKQRKTVEIILKPFPYRAVRIAFKNNQGEMPDYLISGGFVFLELSKFFLKEWGSRWRSKINKKFLYLHDFFKLHRSRQEGKIVILSQVFPNRINNGYHHLSMKIVHSLNGEKIHNVRELAQKIKHSQKRFIKIRLDAGIDLILDKQQIPKADEITRQKFQIRHLQNFSTKGDIPWYHL